MGLSYFSSPKNEFSEPVVISNYHLCLVKTRTVFGHVDWLSPNLFVCLHHDAEVWYFILSTCAIDLRKHNVKIIFVELLCGERDIVVTTSVWCICLCALCICPDLSGP